MSKKVNYISIEKINKTRNKRFFNLMLSNINISELKAKTIYHIYIMIQIKKAIIKNKKNQKK